MEHKKVAQRGPEEAYVALCSMFAVVDDVFSEQDAFQRDKVSLGRIYREWQTCRAVLEPSFKKDRYDHFGSRNKNKSVFKMADDD